jgi:hypothetical protein
MANPTQAFPDMPEVIKLGQYLSWTILEYITQLNPTSAKCPKCRLLQKFLYLTAYDITHEHTVWAESRDLVLMEVVDMITTAV